MTYTCSGNSAGVLVGEIVHRCLEMGGSINGSTQSGSFIMDNPIKMEDLGLHQESST